MSILTKLLGNSKDLQLMHAILDLATKVKTSMVSLNQLLMHYDNADEVKAHSFKIQNLENEGDELVKQIIELISEISITSWVSPDMVLRLIHVLDDVLDNSQSLVRLLDNYHISRVSQEMLLMGGILEQGGTELETLMSLFCQPHWHKHTRQIITHIKHIRDLEHQGDVMKAQGLHTLLNLDNSDKPITMKDLAEFRSSEKMLETLELLTDHIHLSSTIVHQCLSD